MAETPMSPEEAADWAASQQSAELTEAIRAAQQARQANDLKNDRPLPPVESDPDETVIGDGEEYLTTPQGDKGDFANQQIARDHPGWPQDAPTPTRSSAARRARRQELIDITRQAASSDPAQQAEAARRLEQWKRKGGKS